MHFSQPEGQQGHRSQGHVLLALHIVPTMRLMMVPSTEQQYLYPEYHIPSKNKFGQKLQVERVTGQRTIPAASVQTRTLTIPALKSLRAVHQ